MAGTSRSRRVTEAILDHDRFPPVQTIPFAGHLGRRDIDTEGGHTRRLAKRFDGVLIVTHVTDPQHLSVRIVQKQHTGTAQDSTFPRYGFEGLLVDHGPCHGQSRPVQCLQWTFGADPIRNVGTGRERARGADPERFSVESAQPPARCIREGRSRKAQYPSRWKPGRCRIGRRIPPAGTRAENPRCAAPAG
jgi:hypothetical protein